MIQGIHTPRRYTVSRVPDASRPHACAQCGKCFRRRSTLTEHTKTHTGTKPFVCPVPTCQRSFTTSGNLWRHKRMQHPWLDAPNECLVPECGCTFSTETQLERHMTLVHFSSQSHVCPASQCGRAFSTTGNLRRHLKLHHATTRPPPLRPPTKTSPLSPMGVDDVAMHPRAVLTWSPDFWSGEAVSTRVSYTDAELLETLACLFD